ncbi:MAG: hypothetical protein J7513_14800 [Solirubrobacteraceae bacterium]|nr:hypothetical protein [Solirubrobacteraceae bacterium]
MRSVNSPLRKRLAGAAALLGAVFATAASAPAANATLADVLIYPPSVPPLGKTYSTHAANWWKWVLAQPASKSPLTDTDGRFCAQGQSGSVWYLAGSFGDAGSITRTCTVPFGKTIIIPVANGLAAAFVDDPPAQRTEAYLRAQVTPQLKAATNLKASLDGSAVTNPARYFEQSVLFSTTLGAGNIYDLPAGTQLSPAVDAGYYLAIYPPLLGNHTLKVSSTLPNGGGSVDVTYKLKVALGG